MKSIVKTLITIILIHFCASNLNAQENYNLAQKSPQKFEKIIESNITSTKGYNSIQTAYKSLLSNAQRSYPQKDVAIRDLKKGNIKVNSDGSVSNLYTYTIVELPDVVVTSLYEAITKATMEISEGGKFALDVISITDEKTDKEYIKSQIIDNLTRKGYKVVAKDKLEKLYNEHLTQQSEIINSVTKVQENNFSAVGYYISARVTLEYIQVQVINVSTGEYEGNVTITLDK